MDTLIRLIYASTATKPVSNQYSMIQVDVGRILMQARKNNPRMRIGGVLYFSNNYFFQCLEGGQQAVNLLYNRIAEDPRHTNVQSLSVRRVSERYFSNWSMKYVALDANVQRLIQNHGHESFDPYQFDDYLLDEMLQLFVVARDTSSGQNNGGHGRLPSTASRQHKKGWISRLFGRKKRQLAHPF